jgi:glutamate-1-semialdehyde 2,1-aminomutase
MTQAATVNVDLDSALEEARGDLIKRHPRSRQLYDDACKNLPGGNTRTILFYSPFPITMTKGEGCRLWDADGHEYVDFLGEYSAGIYGHSHPVIRKAIDRALDNGVNLGAHNDMESRLAALICARLPSVELVRFTNSGTEANLMGITLARNFTQRKKVLVFDGGYHGGVFTFVEGVSPVNGPFDFVIGKYNDLAAARKTIEANAKDMAAVLIEPMQGGGGCIPAKKEFLQLLRDLCTQHEIVLMFDEVMTSRLSPGGLQAVHGILPDLTTMGKYLGGGMSFGAFGGRADIMARFDPRRPDALPHAGTFNNNVLSMHAGVAGLSQVYTPEVAVALNARGDRLRARLNQLCQDRKLNMQFTGIGSMLAVHFVRGDIASVADAKKGSKALGELFFLDMLKSGIYLARRGMMTLSVPVGDAECDALVAAVDEFQTARRSLLL